MKSRGRVKEQGHVPHLCATAPRAVKSLLLRCYLYALQPLQCMELNTTCGAAGPRDPHCQRCYGATCLRCNRRPT